MSDAADRRAEFVRALQEEREGYLRAGKKDRAAQVDAELARFEDVSSRKAKPQRTADEKPKKRG